MVRHYTSVIFVALLINRRNWQRNAKIGLENTIVET